MCAFCTSSALSARLVQPLLQITQQYFTAGYANVYPTRGRASRQFATCLRKPTLSADLGVAYHTYRPGNIKIGFAAAGLVPFSPDRVVSQLNIKPKTLTLPGSRGSISQRS